MGDFQGEAQLACHRGQGHALHLTTFGLTLQHITRLDYRQAQVLSIESAAKVSSDIGHILVGQGTAKSQGERDATSLCLCAIDGDHDIACAKQDVEGSLRISLQGAGGAAVSNGWAVVTGAVAIDVRDLEIALWQCFVHSQRSKAQVV